MMQPNYYYKYLSRPEGIVDAVLDTDTFNEIDDQYALAYMLKLTERINTKAVYAAPFSFVNQGTPEEGMLKSYDEIKNILALMEISEVPVFKGSRAYLAGETIPQKSPAAADLVERAQNYGYSQENPLYVIAIGAITNVASALLLCPEIADKIVVVWLGGHGRDWPDTGEFNWSQDVPAVRVLFASGAPVIQLPCMGVVEQLTTTGPELKYWLSGKNKLCDYLFDITCNAAGGNMDRAWSRVIWDISAVAWVGGPKDCIYTRNSPSPAPEPNMKHSFDLLRTPIGYVYGLNRDAILTDLFEKLAR